MVVAVAQGPGGRRAAVICASTGNTSASAAAYAAAAGLECVVVLPKGAIALGKLAAGAGRGSPGGRRSTGTSMMRCGRAGARRQATPVTLVNSVNPYRLEGQKTAAFEICDELGDAPDVLAIPVGNAGNISAYWRGFVEYATAGMVASGRGCGASRPPVPRRSSMAAGGAAGNARDRDPDREPGLVVEGRSRPVRSPAGASMP